MDERTAKFLAPIKAICKEIVSSDSIDASIKELIKKITTKDSTFYQFHTFSLLMQLLKDNPVLEANKVKKVFKVLDLILNDSNKKSKRKFAIDFYNYFISLNETSPDILITESLALFKMTPDTEEELLDIHLCFIQKCLSCSKIINDKANVDMINENIRQLIKMDSSEIQVKLLQLLSKIVYNYYSKTKSWTMSIDFLQNSLYQELKISSMKIKTDEAFQEYMNLISTILYSRNADMLKVCCKIIAECHKFLDEKEHKVLHKALHKSLTNLTYSTITDKAMMEVYQTYFKDAKSSSEKVIQHKVIDIIKKHFLSVAIHLEKSVTCVKTSHDFVFALFNLLKFIKAQDETKKCCTDTRRHSIFDLSIEMIKFINRTMDDKIYTKEIEKYLIYYLDYALKIYNDIKCPLKQTMFKILQSVLYDVLATLYNDYKDMLSSDLKKFSKIYNIMISLKESSNDEKIVKHIINLGMCMNNVTFDETEINAQTYAEILTYPILYTLDTKDEDYLQKLPKLVSKLRSAVLKIKYTSAVDYLKKKLKKSDLDVYIDEITLLELKAVSRHDSQNIEGISELFKMVYAKSDNLEYFGRACLSINDRVLKMTDLNKFRDLNERLETYKSDNIQVSIALALNNYYLYCIETESMEAKISEATSISKDQHPSCLNLESEVKILKLLDKFLDYTMDVLFMIKKDPKEIAKIPSMKLFTTILENVSTQYFIRGIANKDLETKLVLWNLLQYDENSYMDMIIDTAAFFLDNLDRMIGNTGHYITFSKRLNYIRAEEVILKANTVLDTLLTDIENKHERHQVRPMNYMLSLWVYYAVNGRKADSLKIWQRFEETRKICNLQAPLYIGTIEAKMHMGVVDISLKCLKKNAADHIYKAMKNLQCISTVYADYANNFQFLYRNIIVKAINYSLNRMIDVDHYASTMMFLKSQAIQKGLFVKTLDFLSLSVIRHLNMEKLDDAKTDLKKMSTMLELDDDVLIETPISAKTSSHVVEVHNNEITVRKAIPKSLDSKSKIEIFNDSFDNTRSLIDQIRNFVHDYSCKCQICEYPHLKFMLFQMGCHYSRLLFLMNKFDISKSFNDYALGPWRHCSAKILRTKENGVFNINKKEFITFSIRWLFQVVDSFVMTKDYSKVEEILTEVELLCTSNIEDYECIKQTLHARMQNLELLLQHGKSYFKDVHVKSMKFEEFLKTKTPKSSTSVMLTVKNPKLTSETKKKSPQSEPSKKTQKASSTKAKLVDSVIYIDSDDSDKEARAKPPKKVASSVPPKSTRSTKKTPEIDITTEKPRTRLRKYL